MPVYEFPGPIRRNYADVRHTYADPNPPPLKQPEVGNRYGEDPLLPCAGIQRQEAPQEPASVVADDGTTRKPYPRRRRKGEAARPLPEDDGKQTGTRVVCPTLEDPRWQRDLSAMNCDLGWPGVYLLWSEGSIVYVGQSGRCLDRVAEHRREAKKRFDKVWVLPCPDHADRLRVEAMLMLEHMPKYNRALCLGFDKSGRCYELGFVLAKTRKR